MKINNISITSPNEKWQANQCGTEVVVGPFSNRTVQNDGNGTGAEDGA